VEESDEERFQFEYYDGTEDDGGRLSWTVKTSKGNYLAVDTDKKIVNTWTNRDDKSARFYFTWNGDRLLMQSAQTPFKFVGAQGNGQLIADFDRDDAQESLEFQPPTHGSAVAPAGIRHHLLPYEITVCLINRPQLVLRGTFGFLGLKGNPGGLGADSVQANKPRPEVFDLYVSSGAYAIQAPNGKFWDLDGEANVVATSDTPKSFFFEFVGHSHIMIKAGNGRYLEGNSHELRAVSSKSNRNSRFEF
jgi:hypothetical protein